eukprot:scaffold307_cov390-Prasinococcus_capsulatus_cf.AAC.22
MPSVVCFAAPVPQSSSSTNPVVEPHITRRRRQDDDGAVAARLHTATRKHWRRKACAAASRCKKDKTPDAPIEPL